MRIGVAILGLVCFVTLAQGIVLGLVFVEQSQAIRETLADEGAALAQLAVARAVGPEELTELGPLEHLRVGLYDGGGERLATSHPDPRIRERLDDSLRERARAMAGRPYYVTPLEPGQPTDFIVSVESEGRTRFLSFYEDSAPRAFPTARSRILVGALVVAVLVALLISWVIARRVRIAIQTTEHTVRRMAAGDLSARLEEPGDDELGQLVRDFNEMAEKLALHVARLEKEEERRRALFAAFTHEINTPLTAVLGYLESLGIPQVEEDPETRRRYVAVAFDQAQKLEALADDLTTLSRLDYDGIVLEREPADLRKIAHDEIAAISPRAEERQVTLRVEGDAVVCEIDRARVGQVVRNLLANAVRHAALGTQVCVRIARAGDLATVEVIDHGEGIPAEHLPLLGTPLYRVDASRARTGGGRGLGLAIAIGLVKAHGGTLEIESTREVGTTVRVTFPRPRANE